MPGNSSVLIKKDHTYLISYYLQIYNDGFRNMNLNIIIRDLAAPCIVWLGLALSIPYVISHSLVPIFGTFFDGEWIKFNSI